MRTGVFKGVLLSTFVIVPLLMSAALSLSSPVFVEGADSYVAYSTIVRGVDVSISPSYHCGVSGATLIYEVVVTNTGNVDDNFYSTVSDNAGWELAFCIKTITLPAFSSATADLSVTIPGGVEPCTRDNIVVTMTSFDNAVSGSDSCIAHRAKADFTLVTLYKAGLDVEFYFEIGSGLVAKFYTYADSYQGESLVWSGTTPDNVSFSKVVPHPENKAVEKVTLALTDNEGNVISIIARFIVTRDDLFGRVRAIKGEWPYASPEEKDALFAEIRGIKGQWPYAPS